MTDDREWLSQIENYVRVVMTGSFEMQAFGIAHGYSHVDRVRHWALTIARQEGYTRLDLVEAAALLHDVGLARVTTRADHAQVGAAMAADFLYQQNHFHEPDIAAIAEAINRHNTLHTGSPLLTILRDADTLDLLGAVGLLRAFSSKYMKPAYEAGRVKGETWGLSAADFTARFQAGAGIGPTIVDQVNFQLSCAENLATNAARALSRPLVAFMRLYLAQLETEVGTRSP